MEVMVPMKDSPFGSTASTPYVSAPSSPKRFGDYHYNYYYGSAPTSPTRAAAIYAAASMVPFNWEEAPGTPKSPKSHVDDDDDDNGFEFEFSGQLEKGVLLPELTAADELFEQGKIRPLKPPPRLYSPNLNDRDSMVSSPKSPKGGGLFSPRHRNKVRNNEEDFDPFTAAMVEATRERGRERGPVPSPSSISSSRSRKGSRSLSPMRGGGSSFMVSNNNSTSSISSSAAAATKSSSGGGSKKWRLRDLLLFRSASEGRVTGNRSKDPLRKYTMLATTNSSSSLIPPASSDSRNSSFRSTDSSTYVGSSMRRGNMSPHEKHYMSNRAAAEESKKKTALPFGRQGLFGCLRFNPAVQSIVRGLHGGSALNRRQ